MSEMMVIRQDDQGRDLCPRCGKPFTNVVREVTDIETGFGGDVVTRLSVRFDPCEDAYLQEWRR